MKLLSVQPSSTSYYFSLGPVTLLSTMFSTSLICSIEYNFKYYLLHLLNYIKRYCSQQYKYT
jgi:hypothetical protein